MMKWNITEKDPKVIRVESRSVCGKALDSVGQEPIADNSVVG
jgi:hypothetical protein